MTFVAQPLAAGRNERYFEKLASLIAQGAGCTEAVVVDPDKAGFPVGSRFLFDAEGEWVASLSGDEPSQVLREGLIDLIRRPRPHTTGGVAYLPQLPRCRLLIVGAGHVGQAVGDLAAQADFDVWVLDDRETYASKERFPSAQRILVGDIGRILRDFSSDENTYCLIVTRGHSHDEEALYHLATKPSRYLGMIGSKRKIRMIFEDLEKEGIPTESLDRVYAPIGLDIGSQTVPEIAVSIVAQLIGHRNQGPDAFPPQRDRAARTCSGG
jgi:xanthine dehydrogenase accessory factor